MIQVFEGTGQKPPPEMIWVNVQTNTGPAHLKIFYKDLLRLKVYVGEYVMPEYKRTNISAFNGDDEGFLNMAWLKSMDYKDGVPDLVAVKYVPGTKLNA